MSKAADERREAILNYLRQRRSKTTLPPSQDEIAEATNIPRTSLRHLLGTLDKDGKIRWIRGGFRTIELL